MLSKLDTENLNTALKGQNIKVQSRPQNAPPTLGIEVLSGSTLKGMRIKLRKLLKRRRRNTEQPRAKETVSKLIGKTLGVGNKSCLADWVQKI
jgi:hypothetical protein